MAFVASLGSWRHEPRPRKFLNFVLKQYVQSGVEELDDTKLKPLLELKYNAIDDAKKELEDISSIRNAFINFQSFLYQRSAI